MSNLWQFALLGVAAGGAYALTALGVLAVYKGSRVVNFAQGALGMVGTYAFWELYRNGNGWPLVPALLVAVLAAAAIGALLYLGVMRVVRNAAEMVRMITTLGILLTVQALAALRYGSEVAIVRPIFGTETFDVAGAVLTIDAVVVLGSVLAMSLVLWLLFHRSALGARAAALQDNALAAAAVGISPHPTGAITWALGAGCATVAGVVLLPVTGLSPTQLTTILIPALAAVLIARFRSIAVTVVAGLAMGVVESVGVGYDLDPGLTKSFPFVAIVIALVLGGTSLPARDEIRFHLPVLGSGRRSLVSAAVVAIGIGLIVALLDGGWQQALITTCTTGLIALSVVVVTGYAGQLSLAPLALAGVSALVSAQIAANWGWGFIESVLAGAVVSALVGFVVGAPAVRVRGANLAIVTLGLAMAIQNIFLNSPSFTGGVYGLTVPKPTLFGWEIDPAAHPGRYAAMTAVVAAAATLFVANIRVSRSGRRYAAIRASERGAAALGVSVHGGKLAAFTTAGVLAGLGGALMAFRFTSVGFQSYDVLNAVALVGLTIVGGVGFISGALFAGVVTVGGLSSLFLNRIGLAEYDRYITVISGAFIVYTMLLYPNGLMHFNINAARALGARLRVPTPESPPPRVEVPAAPADTAAPAAPRRPRDDAADTAGAGGTAGAAGTAGDVALRVQGVTMRFGPSTVLDDVGFEARAGQVLGIIGPNGAGKTTLIDILSGFRRPTAGTVHYRGRQVPPGRPRAAAAVGIARTFQNLELFDDLTVRANLLVATDRFTPLAYFTDPVLPSRGALGETVLAVVERFGLADSLDERVSDLPQGRRRLLAVARGLAREPSVLCLDEPASGVSPAERPTLAAIIRSVATDLGVAVILVEHDVDLVTSVCDELLVLDFGRAIARGRPADVLATDAVRKAYLGQAPGQRETAHGTPEPPPTTQTPTTQGPAAPGTDPTLASSSARELGGVS